MKGRMLRYGLLVTVLAGLGMQASAQGITVRGSGTCQAYLEAVSNSVPEAVKELTWLLGYLSGLAVATDVNVLGHDDAEGMVRWVYTYCQAHPAKYVSDAGDMYYKFLKERMQAVGDAEKVKKEGR
jgi:hypothetical protein